MKDIVGANESVTFLRCTNEAKGTTGSFLMVPRGGSQGLLSTKHYWSILGSVFGRFPNFALRSGELRFERRSPQGAPKGHLRAPEELVHMEMYYLS